MTTEAPPLGTSRGLVAGVGVLVVLALIAIAAPWLAPYAPERMLDIVALKSQAPSLAHPFGTDSYSRDVLSRVIYGTRVSLFFALASVAVALTIGTVIGACIAFAPRAVALLLRRLLELVFSVPRLLVLLAVTGVMGPSASIWPLVLLIGVTGWYGVARLVSDEFDALATREFTLAARAAGVRTTRLVTHHLLPHIAPLLLVTAAFGVSSTVALEAGLSYLGLGIQPPTASWGAIMRDGAGSVRTEWWLTVFPGLATVLPVLACNAVGDALRERFAAVQFAGKPAVEHVVHLAPAPLRPERATAGSSTTATLP